MAKEKHPSYFLITPKQSDVLYTYTGSFGMFCVYSEEFLNSNIEQIKQRISFAETDCLTAQTAFFEGLKFITKYHKSKADIKLLKQSHYRLLVAEEFNSEHYYLYHGQCVELHKAVLFFLSETQAVKGHLEEQKYFKELRKYKGHIEDIYKYLTSNTVYGDLKSTIKDAIVLDKLGKRNSALRKFEEAEQELKSIKTSQPRQQGRVEEELRKKGFIKLSLDAELEIQESNLFISRASCLSKRYLSTQAQYEKEQSPEKIKDLELVLNQTFDQIKRDLRRGLATYEQTDSIKIIPVDFIRLIIKIYDITFMRIYENEQEKLKDLLLINSLIECFADAQLVQKDQEINKKYSTLMADMKAAVSSNIHKISPVKNTKSVKTINYAGKEYLPYELEQAQTNPQLVFERENLEFSYEVRPFSKVMIGIKKLDKNQTPQQIQYWNFEEAFAAYAAITKTIEERQAGFKKASEIYGSLVDSKALSGISREQELELRKKMVLMLGEFGDKEPFRESLGEFVVSRAMQNTLSGFVDYNLRDLRIYSQKIINSAIVPTQTQSGSVFYKMSDVQSHEKNVGQANAIAKTLSDYLDPIKVSELSPEHAPHVSVAHLEIASYYLKRLTFVDSSRVYGQLDDIKKYLGIKAEAGFVEQLEKIEKHLDKALSCYELNSLHYQDILSSRNDAYRQIVDQLKEQEQKFAQVNSAQTNPYTSTLAQWSKKLEQATSPKLSKEAAPQITPQQVPTAVIEKPEPIAPKRKESVNKKAPAQKLPVAAANITLQQTPTAVIEKPEPVAPKRKESLNKKAPVPKPFKEKVETKAKESNKDKKQVVKRVIKKEPIVLQPGDDWQLVRRKNKALSFVAAAPVVTVGPFTVVAPVVKKEEEPIKAVNSLPEQPVVLEVSTAHSLRKDTSSTTDDPASADISDQDYSGRVSPTHSDVSSTNIVPAPAPELSQDDLILLRSIMHPQNQVLYGDGYSWEVPMVPLCMLPNNIFELFPARHFYATSFLETNNERLIMIPNNQGYNGQKPSDFLCPLLVKSNDTQELLQIIPIDLLEDRVAEKLIASGDFGYVQPTIDQWLVGVSARKALDVHRQLLSSPAIPNKISWAEQVSASKNQDAAFGRY